ncbi:LamG domain-containing protein [Leifsonia sp. NPDC056665]|uniref:LamG domain-containing protein n=1 Tax=Leifsonia sp. NPDC056665 TaxID=3345901 RepID=UPI0036A05802
MTPTARVIRRLSVGWPGAVGLAVIVAVAIVFGVVPSTSGGFLAQVANTTNTAGTAPYFTCRAAISDPALGPLVALPLTEAAGSTTASDISGTANTGTYRGPMTTTTLTAADACPRDSGTAWQPRATASYITTATSRLAPAQYTLEVWFLTLSTGGKLVGFGDSITASFPLTTDRQLFIDNTRNLVFGALDSSDVKHTITAPTVLSTGTWYHAVATFSPATGMRLYLNGSLVASDATVTTSWSYFGYWRFGYDNLTGWAAPTPSYFFHGTMRFAAAYSTVFTQAQVTAHYDAGR